MWEQHYIIKEKTSNLNFYESLSIIKSFCKEHDIPWIRDISSGVNGYHRMNLNGVIVDFPYKIK